VQTEAIVEVPVDAMDINVESSRKKAAYFGWRDAIFIIIALATAITVTRLGLSTWADGNRTEILKAQGEAVAAWMGQQGERRQSGQATDLIACNLTETTWADCREGMIAAQGPFEEMRNPFSNQHPVFASSCDRTRLDTQGSLIMEKGTPKPPDGSSLAYSSLGDEETLAEPLSLRLSVCGRGFSVIHVAEFRF